MQILVAVHRNSLACAQSGAMTASRIRAKFFSILAPQKGSADFGVGQQGGPGVGEAVAALDVDKAKVFMATAVSLKRRLAPPARSLHRPTP